MKSVTDKYVQTVMQGGACKHSFKGFIIQSAINRNPRMLFAYEINLILLFEGKGNGRV